MQALQSMPPAELLQALEMEGADEPESDDADMEKPPNFNRNVVRMSKPQWRMYKARARAHMGPDEYRDWRRMSK